MEPRVDLTSKVRKIKSSELRIGRLLQSNTHVCYEKAEMEGRGPPAHALSYYLLRHFTNF